MKLFEDVHNIRLPTAYRAFLMQIGNGGAGPYYGLEPLENSLFEDLDGKDPGLLVNPTLEFPLTEPWNMDLGSPNNEGSYEDEYFENKEREYYDLKWSNGLIRVANFGCGVSINLVVTGKERGNIWMDDRCNDGGIFPAINTDNDGRITFLDWYELWLDESLAKSV